MVFGDKEVAKDILHDGFITLYTSTANLAKNNLAQLKKLYKRGRYVEIKVLAKGYSERLEEFYVLYNIIDKPNESNELL